MFQRYEFRLTDPETAHTLRDLVADLIPRVGLTLVPQGRAISAVPDLDFDFYDFTINDKKVGSFEFRKDKGVYACQFDLSGAPKEAYDRAMTVLRLRYPREFADT